MRSTVRAMKGLSTSTLRHDGEIIGARGAQYDDDSAADEDKALTDVEFIQNLLAKPHGPENKTTAELQEILQKLKSPDATVRNAAARRVHAIKELGLLGAQQKKVLPRPLDRTSSDPRLVAVHGTSRHARQSGNSASSMSLRRNVSTSSSDALDVEQSSTGTSPSAGGHDHGIRRSSSFWSKFSLGKSTVDSATKPLLPWDVSWDVPCDAMGANEWKDPHPLTEKDTLLSVATKRFCVSLKGASGMLPDHSLLEDVEAYRFLYDATFMNRPHVLYLGKGARGPVICAVEVAVKKQDRSKYRVLTLDRNGYHKSYITSSAATRDRLKQLKRVGPLEGVTLRKPEKQQQLGTQLMIFERKRIVHHVKFGVLYRKQCQVEENEVFCNEYGSPQFVSFLKVISDIVALKGFAGFRGGLDVREDGTGLSSCYTTITYDLNGKLCASADDSTNSQLNSDSESERALRMEVMLHVGPFLPYDPHNPQQLHKKRHIGNDIVVVIFCEGSDAFNPEVITSNYNHVFILVRPVPDDPTGRKAPTHYRVGTACVKGVKPFRPYLPEDSCIPVDELRNFLITKVINAERAAMYSPEFSQKLSRTIQTVLSSWCDEFQ